MSQIDPFSYDTLHGHNTFYGLHHGQEYFPFMQLSRYFNFSETWS